MDISEYAKLLNNYGPSIVVTGVLLWLVVYLVRDRVENTVPRSLYDSFAEGIARSIDGLSRGQERLVALVEEALRK